MDYLLAIIDKVYHQQFKNEMFLKKTIDSSKLNG